MMKSFWQDRSGGAAIIFSIALLPILAGISIATEYGGLSSSKVMLQSATDAAALGVAGRVASGSSATDYRAQATGAVTSFVPNATVTEFHVCTATSSDCATSDRGTLTIGQVYTKAQYVRPLAFGGVLRMFGGAKTSTIVATSVAVQAISATQVAFTPIAAKGWYFKVISLWAHRPGASADTLLASYVYQPQYLYQSPNITLPDGTFIGDLGKGQTTSFDANGNVIAAGTSVSLGSYDNAYLISQVHFSPCPPGQINGSVVDPVSCRLANGKVAPAYTPASASTPPQPSANASCSLPSVGVSNVNAFDLTTSTDDAATACFLTINKKQLTPNVRPSVFSILPCSTASSSNSAGIYAWEDSGGWNTQDFFFSVTTTCLSGTGGNTSATARLTN